MKLNQKKFKQFLTGLDKLFKTTGYTVCPPVESAEFFMNPKLKEPFIALNTKTKKHVALYSKDVYEK